MFLGAITNRFEDGSVMTSLVYVGPNMDTAKDCVMRLAERCAVPTTWKVVEVKDTWQWFAQDIPDTLSLGMISPEDS